MPKRHFNSYTSPQYRRYARNAPKYKCTGGCGGSVDRCETMCIACTMDELYGKDEPNDWLDDEPEGAA